MLNAKIGKVGKVLVCGMKGVGKTTVIEQLVYGNLNADTELHPTIEDIYVASVDTGRGARETLRIYDTAGLQGEQAAQLPRHYLQFPDAFVLVYDPIDPRSLDMLADIKTDIDKHKEKKEIPVIVLANVRARAKRDTPPAMPNPVEKIMDRANIWCQRERIKHYTVNGMERPSLYEPFTSLCARLHPAPTKSTFPQLRQVMQNRQKSEA
ncbi:NF-kappa-B inhibitor-interacting Ras-like protein [Drosophila madeirensis]|uniref:Blast:NF-kappa-B inhibitor-interacting Ras-like protein n=3 Tax=obscura subgroup TaxID=32357 RepID=A0A3B0J2K3_DROGU|nr:NF-kappa-B inhibitor-interacting Ras-like protein [Drosophila guanche]XP_034651481.1 NF-kappa-B inhibitor-interacting Ras-like protein [Drosophila subobscura]SPP75674.1 blast:NF-kappa-B inhibitor-interacting Ras-like protein [Drosophila guanche]